MDELIVAAEGCDPAVDVICTPADVSELFVFEPFSGVEWLTRTHVLIMLAAVIVIALLFFAFRKPKLVPGKFQAAMESLVGLVRDGIAKDVIGGGSEKSTGVENGIRNSSEQRSPKNVFSNPAR